MSPSGVGRNPKQRPVSRLPPLPVPVVQDRDLEGLSYTLWSPLQNLKAYIWGVPHRSLVGLLVESLPKDSHDEVDEKETDRADGGFNQEVHVGFSDVRPPGPVHLSRL